MSKSRYIHYINKYFLIYFKNNINISISLIFIGLAGNIISLIIPLLFSYWLSSHLQHSRSTLQNYITIPTEHLLIIISVLVLIKFLIDYFFSYMLRYEAEKFIRELKVKLFSFQLDISYDYYNKFGYDKFLLRYSNDFNSIRNFYLSATIALIVDSLMLVFGFALLAIINPSLTMLIIAILLLYWYFNVYFNNILETSSRLKRNANSRQLSYINRSFRWHDAIVIFKQSKARKQIFKNNAQSILNISKKFIQWDSINKSTINSINFIVVLILFILYSYGYFDSTMSDVVTLILLFQMILPVIIRFFNIQTIIKLGLISLEKIELIFNIKDTQSDIKQNLVVSRPRIEFSNIIFNNAEPINFISEKEKVNNLILPNNVSFIEFIYSFCNLNDKYKGSILINKTDVKLFDYHSIIQNIGVVSTAYPFTGSSIDKILVNSTVQISNEELQNKVNHIVSLFLPNEYWDINEKILDKSFKTNPINSELIALIRGTVFKNKIIFVDILPNLLGQKSDILHEYLESLGVTVIQVKNN